MLIQQIAQGFYNNLLNKEDDLYQERIKICRSCNLIKVDKIFGEECSSCGCILRSKARVIDTNCPLNKW